MGLFLWQRALLGAFLTEHTAPCEATLSFHWREGETEALGCFVQGHTDSKE